MVADQGLQAVALSCCGRGCLVWFRELATMVWFTEVVIQMPGTCRNIIPLCLMVCFAVQLCLMVVLLPCRCSCLYAVLLLLMMVCSLAV